MNNDIKRRGLMLVLSSPSGAGKTTLAHALLNSDQSITLSISATTRPMRPTEVHGKDYYFLPADEFEKWVAQDRFLEHATVFGHRYGTPEHLVGHALESGQDILFDIDWQGTQQLKKKMPSDVVSIFVLPPSHSELERRLKNRAEDSAEIVASRMAKATDEISHYEEYDYIVKNSDLGKALGQIKSILEAERARRTRLIGVGEFVAELTKG
ncbi:MAG TPA: guanylate kinase [Rhizomicrobium sp.]